jgi:DNA-binding response OmpR family regulator
MAESHKKILCIEDDRETAALIAEELVDRGYEVTVAHDGREGLAAILRTMPDLVLRTSACRQCRASSSWSA